MMAPRAFLHLAHFVYWVAMLRMGVGLVVAEDHVYLEVQGASASSTRSPGFSMYRLKTPSRSRRKRGRKAPRMCSCWPGHLVSYQPRVSGPRDNIPRPVAPRVVIVNESIRRGSVWWVPRRELCIAEKARN